MNDNNNNESSEASKEKGEATAVRNLTTPPPLKTLDTLHNIISQKKQKIHKTQNIAETKRLWIEIETLQ